MIKTRSTFRTAIFALLLGLIAMPVCAETAMPATDSDNTRVNARDRDAAEPTADSAGNKASDREIMQGIRKAVVNDASLSTYAKNIKIISTEGQVTLKGPVRSTAERQNIENIAVQVAGEGNVTNQLSVKTK